MINRREAKDELGLNVLQPSVEQYRIIKAIYDDISDELLLNKPFRIMDINGAYVARRGLLESVMGGSDFFSTEGVVLRGKTADGQIAIQNQVSFEGWRHDYSTGESEEYICDDGGVEYEHGKSFQT